MSLILGDSIAIMRLLPSESIDLIVTDPPYRVISGGVATAKGRCSGMLSANDGKIFKHNDVSITDYMTEFYRILKPGSDCYVMINVLNLRELLNVALEVGFNLSNVLFWKKNTLTPSRRYMKNTEITCFFYKTPSRTINNPSSGQVFEWKNRTGDKLHPTEKPVELMEHYILNSSNVGDLVLDPFCGSAPVAMAAIKHGRKWLCIEKDIQYWCVAAGRIHSTGER